MTEETDKIPLDFLHPKEIGEQKALKMAILASQTAFPSIPKNGKGNVKGTSRSGKDYNFEYKYALFQDIMDAVLPILNKNGVLLSQKPFPCLADGNLYIITELEHAETGGKSIVYFPVCSLSNMKQQEIGANQTYAKRYSLVLLGIITEEDTDAQGSEMRTAARGNGQGAKQTAKTPPDPVVPHNPETGEVKSNVVDCRVLAGSFKDRLLSSNLTYQETVDLDSEIYHDFWNGKLQKDQKDTLISILQARQMIFSANSTETLAAAQTAVMSVNSIFRKDGKLEGFLKAKKAELEATSVA